MPDHVHLLISEPPTPSVMLKALKQRVSRDLRRKKRKAASGQLWLPFVNDGLGLPRFWQPRSYDFNERREKRRPTCNPDTRGTQIRRLDLRMGAPMHGDVAVFGSAL